MRGLALSAPIAASVGVRLVTEGSAPMMKPMADAPRMPQV
jgi:hypothetical protein